MSQSTKDTINQAVLRMAKVFNDIDANKFLECLINKTNYDAIVTMQQKQEIDEITRLIILNAKDAETRKEQRNFFYPILTMMMSPDVKDKFTNDPLFKGSIITLGLVFLNNNHEVNHGSHDSSHHDFIALNLQQTILKIIK